MRVVNFLSASKLQQKQKYGNKHFWKWWKKSKKLQRQCHSSKCIIAGRKNLVVATQSVSQPASNIAEIKTTNYISNDNHISKTNTIVILCNGRAKEQKKCVHDNDNGDDDMCSGD